MSARSHFGTLVMSSVISMVMDISRALRSGALETSVLLAFKTRAMVVDSPGW